MLRIGLTGGIGSGKSTVAQIFEVLGIPIFYADTEARRIMNEDENLKEAIIKNFGSSSYTEGELNRSYIASLVFNDQEKLELLNSLTHPVTMKYGNEWMMNQKTSYAIHEAALIFEANVNKRLDYVIGVHAPLQLRIKRAMERDKVTEEEILRRINRQMDQDRKMKLCDFIIQNDEQHLVIPQVLSIHRELLIK